MAPPSPSSRSASEGMHRQPACTSVEVVSMVLTSKSYDANCNTRVPASTPRYSPCALALDERVPWLQRTCFGSPVLPDDTSMAAGLLICRSGKAASCWVLSWLSGEETRRSWSKVQQRACLDMTSRRDSETTASFTPILSNTLAIRSSGTATDCKTVTPPAL